MLNLKRPMHIFLLLISIAVIDLCLSQAMAQEAACRFKSVAGFDSKFWYSNRLATGASLQSEQAAKEAAVKNMQAKARLTYAGHGRKPCVGNAQVVCSDSHTFSLSSGQPFYRVLIGFMCPNDEGYVPQQTFRTVVMWSTDANPPASQDLVDWSLRTLRDALGPLENQNGEYPRLVVKDRIRKQCGLSPDYTIADLKYDLVPRSHFTNEDFAKIIGQTNSGSTTPEYIIRGVCPSSNIQSVTTTDPSPTSAEDSPDPSVNWLHQKDFSNKSYAVATAIAEGKLAKRNLCRMRGGAVDFSYTQKYTEQYWVTIKYRCQYD